MTEYAAPDSAPTFFANIVTSNLFADELVLEFRRFIQQHREVFDPSGGGMKPIPPPGADRVYAVPPIARVVLTYSAAKDLQKYLNEAVPRMDKAKSGT